MTEPSWVKHIDELRVDAEEGRFAVAENCRLRAEIERLKDQAKASSGAGRNLGDTVYLAYGDDTKGMITGIIERPGLTAYLVTWADMKQESQHFAVELLDEPDLS